jgi:thiol-disulfide isomerase/thioredoxin
VVIAALRARYARQRWFRWAVDLGLLLLVIVAVSAWQTRGHLTGAAPSFSLQTLEGKTIDSAQLRGKPVLLAFWAPWCGVCKMESRNFSWVQRVVGDHARVLSVASAWNEQRQVRGYVEEHGVDYPVLLDTTELSGAFRVEAFPTVYFLDAEGRVKHSSVGYTTTVGLLARLLLP